MKKDSKRNFEEREIILIEKKIIKREREIKKLSPFFPNLLF